VAGTCPGTLTISTSGNTTTTQNLSLAKNGGTATFKVSGTIKTTTSGAFHRPAYTTAYNYIDPTASPDVTQRQAA